jgi:hypothetical protein
MINKILVLVFILFCFELGIFLIIFPWSQYWENNFFLFYLPSLHDFVLNNFFRGAVSGLGLVDIGLGFWEAMHFSLTVALLDQKQNSTRE